MENITMTNDCKTCPVSTGTHKPAEAVHQKIDEPQSEALRLAAWLLHRGMSGIKQNDIEASNQLRWLHAESLQHKQELAAYRFTVANREARIAELESQLDAIGAGGVEPLRKQAVAQQALPASVIAGAVFDFAGYLTTLPHKEAIHCSEAHEAAPMVEAITKWCKRRNLTTDGAKVETWRDHLAEAPAHPADGVPEGFAMVPLKMTRAMDEVLQQEGWEWKDLLAAAESITEQQYAALAATQPAAQGMEADLTDAQIDEAFNQMPDGAAGFLKSWGYRQFARAVLAAQAKQGGA